ncbi:MAG: hypothetical protein FWD71_04550 [Oscillospiraceae bacterium]|nr:hypothetical protein [Oscillospiraceae bacterium]
MIIDYIYLKNNDVKRIFISNILHDIKYSDDIDELYIKYGSIDLFDMDKDKIIELCVLATYVEQAFNNRGLIGPKWVYDKRLMLEHPYFIGVQTHDLVLHAPQACLNHNVFMLRNNFEVY